MRRSLPNHEEHRPLEHEVLAMTGTTQTVQQPFDGVTDQQLVVIDARRFREVQKTLANGSGDVMRWIFHASR